MVARTVPDQHGLHIRFQCLGQLSQKEIHDAGVQTRCDQTLGLTGRGTRRRQDIDEPILRLSYGTRSRTGPSPDSRQRPLLTEPRFVFVEDLQAAIGVSRLDFRELLIKLFLNSSCAAGSD